MKTAIVLTLALLIPLSMTNAQAGTPVYKWFNEKGQVQYTRQKPLDREWEEVGAPPPPPSLSPDLNKNAADQIREAVDQSKQKKESAKTAADEKADAKAIARDCKASKANLETFQNRPRISFIGKDGEKTIMPEEERAGRVKKTQDFIDKNCK